MRKMFVAALVAMVTAGFAFAGAAVPRVPEIDPSAAGSALVLITSGLFVIRGLRKK